MKAEVAASILALPSIQELPARKRAFALAFIRSGNGSESVREAGYKADKSEASKGGQVSTQAGRLLRDAAVQRAVREGTALLWQATLMGPDELLARASRIARHDHRRVIAEAGKDPALASLDDETAEAVQGVKIRRELDKHGAVKAETVEYKVASKLQAIELLAKYHRLLAVDASASDFGAAFADAMDRAGRRAALRDSANAAQDAIVRHGNRDAVPLPSAGDAFAEGAER